MARAASSCAARGALRLFDQFIPAVIKVDARELNDEAATLRLLQECAGRGVRLIFKRVESKACHATLLRLGKQAQQLILAQGFQWDLPAAALRASDCAGRPADSTLAGAVQASDALRNA